MNPKKPIEPKMPQPKDFKAYANPFESFKIAYEKFVKSKEDYGREIEIFEQTKFIEDIQRSTLKLCLKKYKITKR